MGETINQNALNNSHSAAYLQLRSKWIQALDFYEPTPNTLGSYLIKYPKEDESEYADRVRRLIQINSVRVVLDFYTSMIFSNSPQVQCSEQARDVIDAFLSNCDGKGTAFDQFARRTMTPQAMLFGVCDVFVDLKRLQQEAKSLAEQRAMGLDKPYCYVVPPLNRVKWKLDEAGAYCFYQSQDKINTEIQPAFQIKNENQWNIWTPTTFQRYKKDGTLLLDDPNPYGFIPGVPVILQNSIRFQGDAIGVSLVDDIVPIQSDILNLLSLITDYHAQSNFQFLHMKLDSDSANDEAEFKEAGAKRVIQTVGSGSDAKYVGPNPEGAREMREHLQELIDQIYKAKYLPVNGSDVKSHTSSETVKTTMALLYNALSDCCSALEATYKRILEMVVAVAGGDPEAADIKVQWNTNFSFEAFQANVTQLESLRKAAGDISKTAVKAYAKKIISAELSRSKDMPLIEKEIDEWIPEKKAEGTPAAKAEDNTTPPSDDTMDSGGD